MMGGRKYHPLATALKAAVILLAAREIQGYPRQLDDVSDRGYSDEDSSYSDDEPSVNPKSLFKETTYDAQAMPDTRRQEVSIDARTVVSVKDEREAIAFVFPDHQEPKNRFPKVDGVKPSPSCKGLTFCEDVPNYPEDLVRKAMLKDPSMNNCAHIDVSLPQRIDVNDDAPLCISTEQIVFPKAAETVNKEWLYVVNSANFTQGVRIELCAEENSRCKMIDGFAEGYVTVCKQRYIYRQLTAITESGTMAPELFRLPSSCCCHVRFTGNARDDLLSRIGVNQRLVSQARTPALARKARKL